MLPHLTDVPLPLGSGADRIAVFQCGPHGQVATGLVYEWVPPSAAHPRPFWRAEGQLFAGEMGHLWAYVPAPPSQGGGLAYALGLIGCNDA